MGKKSAKAGLRIAAAGTMQEAESAKEDVRRSEDIYGQITSLLGAEGTYPGSPGYQGQTIGGGGSLFEETGTISEGAKSQVTPYLKKGGKYRDKILGQLGEQARGIDVNKAVGQITGSKSFQIASQLTAEAQQLINREGPLYERMQRSVNNPILKRGARMMEDSLEELKTSYASGGRARREGLKDAMRMQAQMEANEFVGSQMSQANAQMDVWARENARNTLQFNQAWASNLQGVRNQYASAMSAARSVMMNSAIPAASSMQQQAHAISQQGKKNWVDIGIGALTAVAGVLAAPATGGASLMAAAGGFGKAASAATGGGQTYGGGTPPTQGPGGTLNLPGGGQIYGGGGY